MLTTVETNRLKTPENNLALVGNHNYGSLNQSEKILQKLVSTIPNNKFEDVFQLNFNFKDSSTERNTDLAKFYLIKASELRKLHLFKSE